MLEEEEPGCVPWKGGEQHKDPNQFANTRHLGRDGWASSRSLSLLCQCWNKHLTKSLYISYPS
jgi:hypothetical protein